jgi:hypothetical protein
MTGGLVAVSNDRTVIVFLSKHHRLALKLLWERTQVLITLERRDRAWMTRSQRWASLTVAQRLIIEANSISHGASLEWYRGDQAMTVTFATPEDRVRAWDQLVVATRTVADTQ